MRILAGCLPFVVLGLFACRIYGRCRSWRLSILSATLVWGVTVTAVTEGLSLVHALSFGWAVGAWLTLGVIAIMMPRPPCPHADIPVADAPSSARWGVPLAGVALIVSAVGFIALAAPPNTSDSMIYHMPRVMHWIQNQSVAHYPTHVPRQLHLTPWAEFAILQLQLLSGGDHLANLVQWLAMLGSLVGVSLITRQLGGDARCQILGVVVCATIPMGILQGSSTQNDYVVTFWLLSFVYHACAHMKGQSGLGEAGSPWWLGAVLGLAFLTKATAYIVALPFVAWMIVDAAWRRRPHVLRTMAIVVLAVAMLNAGHALRNFLMFGSPLGPGREGSFVYANEHFGVSTLLANTVRNVALHMGTPNERVNRAMELGVAWVHRRIGADLDDPRTTWLGATFHVLPPIQHEDFAGNPAHLGLIGLSVVLLLLTPAYRGRPEMLGYLAALAAGAMLFAFYLKWQPWHSRLHLPFFVLATPLIAVIWGPRRSAAAALSATLLILSVPWVLKNDSRPLLGPDSVITLRRVDQYFVNRKDLRQPYASAMRYLKEVRCSNIGLWVDDEPEYQLWVLGGPRRGAVPLRIEHVAVANESAKAVRLGRAPFDPCALLIVTATPSIPASLDFQRSVYRQVFRAPRVSVFLRQ